MEAGDAFLAERLGFLRREYVQASDGPVLISWMSVTSQLHDIALTTDPPPSSKDGRLHHISYIHSDAGDVLRGAEIMRDAGVTIDLSPGKHAGQAFFCYVKDPGSGHRVELFAGGYHIFDTDWEPIRWDETNFMTGLVWWGPDLLPGSGTPMDSSTPCLPDFETPEETVDATDDVGVKA